MKRVALVLVFAGGYAGAALFYALPALAAEGDVLDLRPLLTETVIPLLATVLLSLGIAAIAWIKRRLGIEDNRALGEILDKAAVRAVQFAENTLRGGLSEAGWTRLEIKNEILRTAARYVEQQVPDTLKQLGFDPATPEGRAAIDRMIQARLGAAPVQNGA